MQKKTNGKFVDIKKQLKENKVKTNFL